MEQPHAWEDPSRTGDGRLPARAYFFGYADAKTARPMDRDSSLGFRSLSGAWQFRLFDGPRRVQPSLHQHLHADWDQVEVPRMWQLDGYGAPAYTDEAYPFPVDPPRVPSTTPTAVYQHTVQIDALRSRAREGHPAPGRRGELRRDHRERRLRRLHQGFTPGRGVRPHRPPAPRREPAVVHGAAVQRWHLPRGPGHVVALGHLPGPLPADPSRRRPTRPRDPHPLGRASRRARDRPEHRGRLCEHRLGAARR